MHRLLLAGILVLLAGCGERVTPEPQPGDVHHLPPVEWRIVDRDTLRAVFHNSGQTLGDRDNLQGFVGSREGHWVIYTLPPARVDDAATCTLGHEIMHITHGDYH